MKKNHNDYDFSFKKQNLLFITSKTHSNNDFFIYLKTDSAFFSSYYEKIMVFWKIIVV